MEDSAPRREDRHAIGYLLLLVLIATAFIRLTAVLNTEVLQPVRADAFQYVQYAINLEEFGIYSSKKSLLPNVSAPEAQDANAYRTPGYPLFLSLWFDGSVTERELLHIQIFQAFLGIVTALLTFLVARYVVSGYWALLPAFIVGTSPRLASMDSYILTEPLFTFLLILSVWLFARSHGRYPHIWAAVSGLAMGCASLTRPVLKYVLVVLPVLLWRARHRAEASRRMIAMVLGFILVISPWNIRNAMNEHVESGERVAVQFLHHGMYPGFMYEGNPHSYGKPQYYDPQRDEISSSLGATLTEIVSRFRERPLRHLQWYLIGKPLTLLSWDTIDGVGGIRVYPVRTDAFDTNTLLNLDLRAHRLFHPIIAVLALVGCALVWTRPFIDRVGGRGAMVAQFASLIIVYLLMLHIVGTPRPRYAIPFTPLLAILATLPVWRLMNAERVAGWFRARQARAQNMLRSG